MVPRLLLLLLLCLQVVAWVVSPQVLQETGDHRLLLWFQTLQLAAATPQEAQLLLQLFVLLLARMLQLVMQQQALVPHL
jgi:hypothetical protein